MAFTFPQQESFDVTIRTGHTTDGSPILYIGDKIFDVPSLVYKVLSRTPGFDSSSRQEQIKSYLYGMLKAAK